MNRQEQIRQQIQILEDQLAYTKTPIIEQNCKRTKRILEAELNYLQNKKSDERFGDKF